VRVYCHWVYIAKCIVDVYCDRAFNASSGYTGIVGIYSDWMYNAKCIHLYYLLSVVTTRSGEGMIHIL